MIQQAEPGDQRSLFTRTIHYILYHETLNPLARFVRSIEERFFDWRLNIETWVTIEKRKPVGKTRCTDSSSYIALRYGRFRRIQKTLDFGPDDVAYDVGCGKGRLLCLMARHPVKKVVGIELDEDLSRIATRNAARLRGKRAPIEVVCDDACNASLKNGTIYIFYSPFGPETLKRVIDRIHETLIETPREIRIVYFNPKYEEVLSNSGWLVKYSEHFTHTWSDVSQWRSNDLRSQTQDGPRAVSRFPGQ